MPFIDNSPESLLRRTDSLDPATTCHGITSSGKPCRRGLNDSALSAPPRKKVKRAPTDLSDTSLYCFQHRDQAARRAALNSGPRISHSGARRSSIDTLTERLGLTILNDTQPQPPGGRDKSGFHFCCFTIPTLDTLDEQPRPARPQPRPIQPQPGRRRRRSRQASALIPENASPETAALLTAEMEKPVSQHDEPGYIYIFWLTPESAQARSLLAPPSKPHGGEKSSERSASDVLAAFASSAFDTLWGDSESDDEAPTSRARERRTKGKRDGKKTILLKIGRATNVHRRLNEWKRQCGFEITLIRYYPYVSSTLPSGSPGSKPRTLPHSHKVERLVHIELEGAGLRVLDGDKCSACGKQHREWFEVEATRSAIRRVDDIVRKWSDWDEGR